jgi:hypothetical protein
LDRNAKRIAVVLLLVFRPTHVVAARLTPWIASTGLGVAITQIALPRTLRSDLSSGLTNRIVLQIVLLKDTARVRQRTAEITVKYDLWDETYRMTVTLEGTVVMSQTYPRVDEVMSALSSLRLPGLFAAGDLPNSARMQLVVKIVFDPIEKARLEEQRQWVQENTAPAPLPAAPNVSEIGPGARASAPVPQQHSLFDRIFEQYVAGATVAGTWQDSGSSLEFELKGLRREPPP